MDGIVPASEVVMKDHPEIRLSDVVSDIKDFAVNEAGLNPTNSYSDYYPTDKEGINFVVSASSKFKLDPYMWCIRFVGCTPHRGFFDESKARELEEKLKEEGYDTFVFPAAAYSTLGAFDDPLTPFMLDRGLYGLVQTVVHEMTHEKAGLSEELASFVGSKVAEQYLLSKGGNPERIIAGLELKKERSKLFSSAMQSAMSELEVIYSSGKSEEYMLAAREKVFDCLRSKALEIVPDYPIEKLKFNNARLLNEARYSPDSGRIQELWDKSGGSWEEFWKLAEEYTKNLNNK